MWCIDLHSFICVLHTLLISYRINCLVPTVQTLEGHIKRLKLDFFSRLSVLCYRDEERNLKCYQNKILGETAPLSSTELGNIFKFRGAQI